MGSDTNVKESSVTPFKKHMKLIARIFSILFCSICFASNAQTRPTLFGGFQSGYGYSATQNDGSEGSSSYKNSTHFTTGAIQLGYFIHRNFSVGAEYRYELRLNKGYNYQSLSRSSLKQETNYGGVFLRYQKKFSSRFAFLSELRGDWGTQKDRFVQNDLSPYTNNSRTFELSLTPKVLYFLRPNLSMELSVFHFSYFERNSPDGSKFRMLSLASPKQLPGIQLGIHGYLVKK